MSSEETSQPEVRVYRVAAYSDELAAGIGALYPEVNPQDDGSPLSEKFLREIVFARQYKAQFVAECAGEIIGAATVNTVTHGRRKKAYLDYLVSSPEMRGRGVGFRLWRAACEWSMLHGADKLVWTSSYDNTEAHAFYHRQGAAIKDTAYFEKELDPTEFAGQT